MLIIGAPEMASNQLQPLLVPWQRTCHLTAIVFVWAHLTVPAQSRREGQEDRREHEADDGRDRPGGVPDDGPDTRPD
jgi:hypothetical protein